MRTNKFGIRGLKMWLPDLSLAGIMPYPRPPPCYASHIKTTLDAASISVMKGRSRGSANAEMRKPAAQWTNGQLAEAQRTQGK
jgi:hypothetical protein